MRLHYLLFAFLLVFLLPAPGFAQRIRNPVSCLRNKGFCHPIRCPSVAKTIGSCAPGLKCCRK
ncbi:defensin beta 4A-like [Tenrec ecaudatus]|uniref:defensin beta 4A-like n=1 Tax=Tenrec ecaudatus TaxID=94439 RepID=UPI003F5ABC31